MVIGIILGIIIFVAMMVAFVIGSASLDVGEKGSGIALCILGVALLISFILVPFSFHTIDSGEVAVVKHLGKIVDKKDDGTHFDLWITDRYMKYDTKVREITFEEAAYSSDAQQMKVKSKFQYQIIPDKVINIAKTYGSLKSLETRISSIISEKTKSVLSSHAAMNIIENRSSLSPTIEKAINEVLKDEYYVNVVSYVITNIDFSDAFENAVEEKMIAEQKQLKAKYEADAKIVTAEATAKANALLEQTLTDKILQEMYLKKWDGKLPQVVTNGNTMFQIPSLG